MTESRILIVDDEADLRDLLSHQMKPLGVKIDLAANGRIALDLIRANAYVTILSDISMPQMNGLELLSHLRREGFDTPFVILTGFGDKIKAVEALRLGAFDFLEKPWETDKLRATVRRAVEHGVKLRALETELELMLASFAKGEENSEAAKNIQRVKNSLMLLKINRHSAKKAS